MIKYTRFKLEILQPYLRSCRSGTMAVGRQ